jgi:hypothetical protein
MQTVKLIKKHKPLERRAKIEFSTDPNRWSREVKMWISEFQKHHRGESLLAFDRLFRLGLSVTAKHSLTEHVQDVSSRQVNS